MGIYLFEVALVFLLWKFKKYKIRIFKRKIDGKVFYLGLCFFMFGMTMALRKYNIGSDTATYYGMYQDIARATSLIEALEISKIPSAIVYVGLHYFITRIVYFPQLGILINSLIITVGFFEFIKNKSNDYLLSCILFIGLTLFYESMNGTRQFMAISLAVNAFSALEENIKDFKGWLLFLFAIGIHNTIIVFAISYLGVLIAKYCKSIRRIHYISITVSLCIALLFPVGVRLVVKIFPYYEMYINGNNPAQIFASNGKGRIALLYLALLLALTMASWLTSKKEAGGMNAYHFGCTICLVLGVFFSKNVLMIRILWPFLTLLVVYLPNLLRECTKKKNMLLLYMLSSCLPLLYSMIHLFEDKSEIVPYFFFWQ